MKRFAAFMVTVANDWRVFVGSLWVGALCILCFPNVWAFAAFFVVLLFQITCCIITTRQLVIKMKRNGR